VDRNAPLRRAPTNPHTHAYLLVARKDELEVWAVVYCVEDGKNRAAGVSKYMLYPMKPQQLMHDLRACHDVTQCGSRRAGWKHRAEDSRTEWRQATSTR
jgi:hypothetical protein